MNNIYIKAILVGIFRTLQFLVTAIVIIFIIYKLSEYNLLPLVLIVLITAGNMINYLTENNVLPKD